MPLLLVPGSTTRAGTKRLHHTLDLTEMDHDWMRYAACRDRSPAEFFPSDGVGVEVAKRTCVDCPVRLDCLEYALVNR
ncbi:MAG: WhiB family transcriptional regulator, partial [bacterium]